MKQWTQHDARNAQTIEAGQFNAEHQAFRSQMTGLDRAQYPEGCLVPAQISASALHKCWAVSPWDTGVTDAQGEQTVLRESSASTYAEQFRAINYKNFGSGWITAFQTTLTPFKGGNLLVEWYGNCAIQVAFNWSFHCSYVGAPGPEGTPNDKFLGLRILFNGAIVAERIGPAKAMDCYMISGSQQMPSGPVVVTLQAKPGAAGPDDPVENFAATYNLMQCHMFGNRIFAIGRFR